MSGYRMDYNHDGKRAVVWKCVRPRRWFRPAEWACLAQESFNTKDEAETWASRLVAEDAKRGLIESVYWNERGGQDSAW